MLCFFLVQYVTLYRVGWNEMGEEIREKGGEIVVCCAVLNHKYYTEQHGAVLTHIYYDSGI